MIDGEGIKEQVDLELLAADACPGAIENPVFVGCEVLEKWHDPQLSALTKESVKILKRSEIYRIMARMLGCS